MPEVSEVDSLVPQVVPVWVEIEPPAPPGRAKPRSVARDCPPPRELDSLPEVETATETESPTVLV